MSVQTQSCDPRRIAGFLEGQLSDAELATLEEHLSACVACRASLDLQAADEELWDKASRYLRDDNRGAESFAERNDAGAECHQEHSVQQVLDSLGPTDDPEMFGRLGGYEVSGVVGSGGMGVVLKAHDKSLDRIVAIKMMAPHLASNGAARKRFAREAKAAAAVLHPNVIAIHSVSSDEYLPYLVMPYLRGPSLQRRLDTDGPLRVSGILRIASQTAAGLAAAHAQGLVHRDIKPANILLEEGVERVAITDFGLARAVDDASMTRTGVVAGTPQYMSPEQARGESVDQRSDLFSLGSVMYAMCTGRAPFRAESSYGVLRRITDTEPLPIRDINPDVPEWLCRIIMKLMAKSPDDRFDSAEQVAELLEDCLAHVQQPTAAPLPAALTVGSSRWRRPPIGKFIAAAAFAFALIFAGALIVLESNKGTLTIETEVDGIPIRITQGDKIVEEMTVTKGEKSTRIAAGSYVVEVDGTFSGVSIVGGGTVLLQRGGASVVRIVRKPFSNAPLEKERTSESLERRPLRNEARAERGSDRDAVTLAKLASESELAARRSAEESLERAKLHAQRAQHELDRRGRGDDYGSHGGAPRHGAEPDAIAGAPVQIAVEKGKIVVRDTKDRAALQAQSLTIKSTPSPQGGPSDTRMIDYRGRCVRAEDGVPIAGAVARFFIRGKKRSSLRLLELTTTDHDGQFRIDCAIPNGTEVDLARCQIAVTATGRASRTFFWQESSQRARIEMHPSASLKGRVTDSAFRPVAGARVRLGPNRLPGVHDAVTDQDGKFEIADLVKADALDLGSGIPNVLYVEHPDGDEATARVESIPSTVDVILKETRGTTREVVPGGEREEGDRVETLRRRWKLLEEAYKRGEASLREVLTAAGDLAAAEVAASESSDERRQARQNLVDALRQLKTTVERLYRAAEAGKADVLAVEAHLQKARAELQKAQAASK